jgi:DNA-directed RNA polymerase specialized sigma24 family protein
MLKGSRSGPRHEMRIWILLVLCGPRVERMLRAMGLTGAEFDEAYIRVMEVLRNRLVTVRSVDALPAFLATVIRRTALDWMRKRKFVAPALGGSDWQGRANAIPAPVDSTSDASHAADPRFALIREIVAGVRERVHYPTWEIYEMAELDGVSRDETAAHFGVTKTVVDGTVRRVRLRLKREYARLDSGKECPGEARS